jgi:hypothetical protein
MTGNWILQDALQGNCRSQAGGCAGHAQIQILLISWHKQSSLSIWDCTILYNYGNFEVFQIHVHTISGFVLWISRGFLKGLSKPTTRQAEL